MPGVTSVVFELSGGSLNDQVVATGTSTIYGWLAQWNSTTVPNGTYSLVSVATDKDEDTDTSTPVSITVNNPLPTTSILIPSTGATLSGSTYLDASASNATAVNFLLFGGSYGYAAPGDLYGHSDAVRMVVRLEYDNGSQQFVCSRVGGLQFSWERIQFGASA